MEGLNNTLIIKPNWNLNQEIKINNLNSNLIAVQNSEQESSSIKESLNGKNHTQLPEPKLNIHTKSDIFEPDFKYDENKIYV